MGGTGHGSRSANGAWRNGARPRLQPAQARRMRRVRPGTPNAIVIDGLGGINDPYGAEDDLRLSDRAWAEIVRPASPSFATRCFRSATRSTRWEQFQKILGHYHDYFRANPDRLKLVERAADI